MPVSWHTNTELSVGGNGLLNFDDAMPFAIPKNSLKKVWNHIARFRGCSVQVNIAQIAYDAAITTESGLRISDQVDMYNSAPNKYNWKLVGKQEMYIPYSAYKMVDAKVSYDDIVKPNHANQNFSRYELHRVWKVEGTLKEGECHIYAKRTFYIDEDSRQVSVADHYDNRCKLWRISEGHPFQFVGVNTSWYVGTTNYDLFFN